MKEIIVEGPASNHPYHLHVVVEDRVIRIREGDALALAYALMRASPGTKERICNGEREVIS